MDKTALMAAVQSGNGLTAEQQSAIAVALDSHEQLEAVRSQVAAFDWKSLLTGILPFILGFIPGLAPLVPIINAILKLLNINIVMPTPNGGTPDPN